MRLSPSVFSEHGLDPAALDSALLERGGFFVELDEASALLDRMLEASRAFFALPREEKVPLSIERSGHFRGWSEMQNERDWREQLHLGRERSPGGDIPSYRRLEGPNLWPQDVAWREIVSTYLEAAAHLGERILRAVAHALGMDPTHFERVASDGYLVAKLIGYHPQPSCEPLRSGVAAHVDFSWLTVNLQDSGGLEVRRPDGHWTPVDLRPGAVWVHGGELLQHATGGRYLATPHRVINRSSTHTRVSIPVFVNPPLEARVPVFVDLPQPGRRIEQAAPEAGDGHVHRVLPPVSRATAFHFGAAEWKRKGLGGWCFSCCPGDDPQASA